MLPIIILIICSYLLGAVPFGLIITKAHGKDLRTIGSGNIGATNVSRALGKKWAYFCFALDVLKGLLPTIAAGGIIGKNPQATELLLWLAVGAAAIIGHVFPVYLKFKGGKGAATSFGVTLGVWPYYTIAAVAAIIMWAICVFIWRYISLASIIAAAAFPLILAICAAIAGWQFENIWPLLAAAVVLAILIVWRHRENIKRIIDGCESKVLQKKGPSQTDAN